MCPDTALVLSRPFSVFSVLLNLVPRAAREKALGTRLGTVGLDLQWATKVLRHFVIFEYLRQISFLISTILPPPPFSMLNSLSLEFASFLYNIEKGGGGLALNINRI